MGDPTARSRAPNQLPDHGWLHRPSTSGRRASSWCMTPLAGPGPCGPGPKVQKEASPHGRGGEEEECTSKRPSERRHLTCSARIPRPGSTQLPAGSTTSFKFARSATGLRHRHRQPRPGEPARPARLSGSRSLPAISPIRVKPDERWPSLPDRSRCQRGVRSTARMAASASTLLFPVLGNHGSEPSFRRSRPGASAAAVHGRFQIDATAA